MPLLIKRPTAREAAILGGDNGPARGPGFPASGKAGPELLPQCGNRKCGSGWMKLWRGRQGPVLDGEWACSPACMWEIAQAAILREAGEPNASRPGHQHRVPIGLVLLSRGVITQEQLRKALDAQRKERAGKLGEWLVRQKAIDEAHVARALSAQWNCPVLAGGPYNPAAMAPAFPRLLIDSLRAVPLRTAGREILYVAFEDKIDRCLALAIERMLGLKVEAGVLRDAEFAQARQAILRAPFPKTRLLEVANMRGLVHAVTTELEERKPSRSRILRVGDYFWLRIWRRAAGSDGPSVLPAAEDVEDLVCSLASD